MFGPGDPANWAAGPRCGANPTSLVRGDGLGSDGEVDGNRDRKAG
jgi:hypothetical protein